MKGRFDNLREIERLDPERDCQRIMHLSFGYEFCWDSTRALELALYRTYCVPSISGLLDGTGEFYRQTQRRYDDTAILIAEMCEWGYECGRGRKALERINWAHSHFTISNDDLLYVLSAFVYEPIHWIDRYGWRPTCRTERLGYYHFWQGIGTRMGIHDIPPTYEAFEDWARTYECRTFRYTDTNRRIGTATRDLFASWYPQPLAPLIRLVIHALLDDAMLDAFGFPRPLLGTRRLIGVVLKLRGRIVRWFPPRRKPDFFSDRPNRTHSRGQACVIGVLRMTLIGVVIEAMTSITNSMARSRDKRKLSSVLCSLMLFSTLLYCFESPVVARVMLIPHGEDRRIGGALLQGPYLRRPVPTPRRALRWDTEGVSSLVRHTPAAGGVDKIEDITDVPPIDLSVASVLSDPISTFDSAADIVHRSRGLSSGSVAELLGNRDLDNLSHAQSSPFGEMFDYLRIRSKSRDNGPGP